MSTQCQRKLKRKLWDEGTASHFQAIQVITTDSVPWLIIEKELDVLLDWHSVNAVLSI